MHLSCFVSKVIKEVYQEAKKADSERNGRERTERGRTR